MSSRFLPFIDVVAKAPEYLILDTETSGLGGEIIEISIISSKGNVLLDTTLKPKSPIEPDSIKVHHVTDEMCKNSPTWPEIIDRIKTILSGKVVIAYNALYDRKAFHTSSKVWNLPKTDWAKISTWRCAMQATADLLCVDKLRWWRLSKAAEILKIDLSDIKLHSSLGDTILAARVVEALIKFSKGELEI